MLSVVIVVVKPSGEVSGALGGARVRATIGPFSDGSLDEAFGLAVCAWAIGSSEGVADLPVLAESADKVRSVSGAIVRKQAQGSDTSSCKPLEGMIQKALCGLSALIGQNLDVGQAGVIIDADVGELPADAFDSRAPIAVDAVTHASDTSQFLGIGMQEIPGGIPFITPHRLPRLQVASARQASPSQDATNR